MSDFVLTGLAYKKAESDIEVLIKEYNNPELTQRGKREALLNTVALSFIAGYKLSQDEVDRLRSKISGLFEEIKHGDESHQCWLKNKIDEYSNIENEKAE